MRYTTIIPPTPPFDWLRSSTLVFSNTSHAKKSAYQHFQIMMVSILQRTLQMMKGTPRNQHWRISIDAVASLRSLDLRSDLAKPCFPDALFIEGRMIATLTGQLMHDKWHGPINQVIILLGQETKCRMTILGLTFSQENAHSWPSALRPKQCH